MSTGADRKANTWGGGALEAGDPRLVEDGSKRNGAFSSDLIPTKTVSEGGQDEKRRKACQWALTEKEHYYRVAAHLRLEIIVSLRTAASVAAPSAPMRLFPILRGMGGGTVRGQVRVSGR